MPDFRAYVGGKVRDRDGGGCPYLSGADGGPLAGEISVADNFIHCDSSGEPAGLHVLYRVDDFGEVVLNTLPLPGRDDPYNLTLELIRSKLAQIYDRRNAWSTSGFSPSRKLGEEVERSRNLLEKAEKLQTTNPIRCATLAEKALTRILWAAEGLAVEAGRHGVEAKISDGSSKQMLLGANFFGFNSDDEYNRQFAELFNYATLPFYWRSFEPEPGAEQWHGIHAMLDWLRENGIKAKGHPLVWFHEPCYPVWAHRDSFMGLRRLNADRVSRVVSGCKGRVPFWDVINEAHGVDHANMFGLSNDQLVEMTGAAVQAAREADPNAGTVINVCAPFGEYAAGAKDKWCPLGYLAGCVDKRIEFDAIGVQCYFGSGWAYCRDLLEISARLDRYGAFGKPVHVTEIGCPSSARRDPDHQLGSATVADAGQWHGNWCEALQAEWAEKLYTIACSKPFVEAVTWWDLSDSPQHFFTHSGLLRSDFSPKPAYHRLLELAHKLGVKEE